MSKQAFSLGFINAIIRDIVADNININHSNDIDHGLLPPVFIGILNGSFVFLADLIRYCNFDLKVDFCKVKSYSENQKKELKLVSAWDLLLEGQTVIIVDDILETGETLKKVVELVKLEKPRSIETCVLFKRKNCKYNPTYYGIELNHSDWIFGYGLDDNELRRNLKDIWKKE